MEISRGHSEDTQWASRRYPNTSRSYPEDIHTFTLFSRHCKCASRKTQQKSALDRHPQTPLARGGKGKKDTDMDSGGGRGREACFTLIRYCASIT